MTVTCRLHGLDVASPFALGHLAADGSSPDVSIEVDEERIARHGSTDPPGELIASFATDRRQYALVRTADGSYLYRFHDFADIEITRDRRHLRCHMVEGAPEGVLPVILAGNVLATLLLLHGDPVLHASAVERDGRTIALVGNSGAGKSTIAAMACLAGGRLVTDDVLRLAIADEVACFRG